jgi:hypothetical protein
MDEYPELNKEQQLFIFHQMAFGWNILERIVEGILLNRRGPIVEIGMGVSTIIFDRLAKAHNVKLYSCDIRIGGSFLTHDQFKVLRKPLSENHICFEGTSEDFMKQFDDTPMIVFLDGEHTYDMASKEAHFFLDRLQVGGVLFMHDTFPHDEKYLVKSKCNDLYKLRQELERNPDLDVLTFPYSACDFGLTMVMRHEKNVDRPYWQRNGRHEG